jgi:glycosyltransferase involved in cell wall biosynthesis
MHGIATAFDVDDLIFEPEFVDKGHIYFVTQLSADQQQQWKEKIQTFRDTMNPADFCITSTENIRSHIRAMGKQSYCVPNGFSVETLSVSRYWQAQFAQGGHVKRIGYASGSPTHAGDFACIAEPLADFLANHPDWLLTVVGYLDLSPYGKIFNGLQVEHRPHVEHVNLAYEMARFDINVIPLDRNPFCDSKSPLKYFEAAICGVPSIATDNPMFRELFGDERTGLLASTPAEWRVQLERLAADEAFRAGLADRALAQCHEKFAPDSTADGFKQIFRHCC